MLRWRDPTSGAAGGMAVFATDYKTRAESRRQLEELRERILAWRTEAAPAPAGWWPLPPAEAPGGTTAPVSQAEPGAAGRHLLIGLALAIVAGVGFGLMGKVLGIRVPIYGPIAIVVIGAQVISQAYEAYRKKKR